MTKYCENAFFTLISIREGFSCPHLGYIRSREKTVLPHRLLFFVNFFFYLSFFLYFNFFLERNIAQW